MHLRTRTPRIAPKGTHLTPPTPPRPVCAKEHISTPPPIAHREPTILPRLLRPPPAREQASRHLANPNRAKEATQRSSGTPPIATPPKGAHLLDSAYPDSRPRRRTSRLRPSPQDATSRPPGPYAKGTTSDSSQPPRRHISTLRHRPRSTFFRDSAIAKEHISTSSTAKEHISTPPIRQEHISTPSTLPRRHILDLLPRPGAHLDSAQFAKEHSRLRPFAKDSISDSSHRQEHISTRAHRQEHISTPAASPRSHISTPPIAKEHISTPPIAKEHISTPPGRAEHISTSPEPPRRRGDHPGTQLDLQSAKGTSRLFPPPKEHIFSTPSAIRPRRRRLDFRLAKQSRSSQQMGAHLDSAHRQGAHSDSRNRTAQEQQRVDCSAEISLLRSGRTA
nr:serine/arginine repetitive matrix protein 1-like [Penaeus vannamei]